MITPRGKAIIQNQRTYKELPRQENLKEFITPKPVLHEMLRVFQKKSKNEKEKKKQEEGEEEEKK